MQVDVFLGGVHRRTFVADRDLGLTGAPGAFGFTFDLMDVVDKDALEEDVTVAVAGSNQALAFPMGHLGRSGVMVEVSSHTDMRVAGVVLVPLPVPLTSRLELLLNGDVADLLIPGERDGRYCRFEFDIALTPDPDFRDITLAVRRQHREDPLGLEPLTLRLPRPECIVSNPCFEAWDATGPQAWDIAPRLAKVLAAGPPPLSAVSAEDLLLGGQSAVFTLHEIGVASDTVILSQDVNLSLLDHKTVKLDLLTCVAGSEPCSLLATLEVTDQNGEARIVSTKLAAWPQWAMQVHRIVLPESAGNLKQEARLSLSLAGAAPQRLKVALCALGVTGFKPPRVKQRFEGVLDIGAEPTNAVRNGDVTRWGGNLHQVVSSRRFECAEGWQVVSKVRNPGLQVGLDRVDLRDPALSIASKSAYAICLDGPISKGYLRLETELDAAQLRRRLPEFLEFYAKAKAADRQISKIFVILRSTLDKADSKDDAVQQTDTAIVVLGRRVSLARAGRFHRISLTPANGGILQEKAREVLADSSMQLFLVFEFELAADCALTSVRLGAGGDGRRERPAGFLRLEDGRIAAQTGRIKLLSSWSSPAPVAPRDDARPPAVKTAVWSRPSPDFPSIDIVICVYDAIDHVMACLNSIVTHTNVPYTLTIIDDGSTVPTALTLAAFAEGRPWVRLRPNGQNLGYTRSANAGLAGSDAEWVILLNSDTIVSAGWIDGLLECAQSDPSIRFVGAVSNAASWQSVPEVKDAAGKWKVNYLPDGMTIDEMAELVRQESKRAFPSVPLLNGFCTMIHRATLDELGYLDEASFPMGYGEENDLCLRAGKAGYRLAVADHVYVYHSKSASFGTSRRAELSKRGNEALAAKHPDVSMKDLEKEFSECAPLIELRSSLRRRLRSYSAGTQTMDMAASVENI